MSDVTTESLEQRGDLQTRVYLLIDEWRERVEDGGRKICSGREIEALTTAVIQLCVDDTAETEKTLVTEWAVACPGGRRIEHFYIEESAAKVAARLARADGESDFCGPHRIVQRTVSPWTDSAPSGASLARSVTQKGAEK
jgi:hypothetical protein